MSWVLKSMLAMGSTMPAQKRSLRCRRLSSLNIGHFLIGESVFEGLAETIKFMRAAMDRGRKRRAHDYWAGL